MKNRRYGPILAILIVNLPSLSDAHSLNPTPSYWFKLYGIDNVCGSTALTMKEVEKYESYISKTDHTDQIIDPDCIPTEYRSSDPSFGWFIRSAKKIASKTQGTCSIMIPHSAIESRFKEVQLLSGLIALDCGNNKIAFDHLHQAALLGLSRIVLLKDYVSNFLYK